jgi:hypothetical protein
MIGPDEQWWWWWQRQLPQQLPWQQPWPWQQQQQLWQLYLFDGPFEPEES